MKEKSSLNFLSKELRLSCSETNNFGVFPFKQSMFLFLREIEKASLPIIIGGVKFLKVFQIDVCYKTRSFLRSPAPHTEVMPGSC